MYCIVQRARPKQQVYPNYPILFLFIHSPYIAISFKSCPRINLDYTTQISSSTLQMYKHLISEWVEGNSVNKN